MSDFRKQWDIEMAMEVLGSQNVDGDLWSEAAKWLLLYGPPQIKEMLGQASNFAFIEYFPQLQAKGYDDNGQPFYDLADIAETLGIDEGEVASKLAELQFEEGLEVVVEGDRVYKIH